MDVLVLTIRQQSVTMNKKKQRYFIRCLINRVIFIFRVLIAFSHFEDIIAFSAGVSPCISSGSFYFKHIFQLNTFACCLFLLSNVLSFNLLRHLNNNLWDYICTLFNLIFLLHDNTMQVLPRIICPQNHFLPCRPNLLLNYKNNISRNKSSSVV